MLLSSLTLQEASDSLQQGKATSVQLTRACLEQIQQTKHLGAYLHVSEELALKQAQASDDRRAQNAALGPLDGIPMALKDILLTQNMPTTCGSKILENFIPTYNGTAVQRLLDAGMVLLGKLNMDEFGMGSANLNSAYFPCYNPKNTDYVAGGSSGGSAAALAANTCMASLGTDTGGSIRQPSAWCGTVGLKPTYGRVSRYGVMAFASSLDQVGPMTKTVTDCAMLLQCIAGHDERDSTSAQEPVPNYLEQLEQPIQGLRIGVPQEYFQQGLNSEVQEQVQAALQTYQSLGATLVPISLPHTRYGIATYYIVASAEASSNLARYDGVRYGLRIDQQQGLLGMYTQTRGQGFGPEVKRRILLGTYALSSGYYDAYYVKAQRVRTLVQQDFTRAFEQVDVIMGPTTPAPAFKANEKNADPVQDYLGDVFTVTANLAGIPGISIPCGSTLQGLPIGLQILGPAWSEARLLQVARAFERESSASVRRSHAI